MANFLRHTRTARFTAKNDKGQHHERRREVTIASATVVGRAQIKRTITNRDWQEELWDYFDTIGELRFATRWLANAISRCILYVGAPGEEGEEPVPLENTPDNELPLNLLKALHYGQIGQAEMLRRMALHLSVPGETFLVGLDPRPELGINERRWYVASNDEINVSARGQSSLILPESGQTVRIDPENSTIIRIWIPHPRKGSEPDSAVRATIPVLREIKGLSDHISATIDSRLAGAGVLKVPHSATAPSPQQTESGPTRPLHNDEFTAALMEAMLKPISDRDDASAVVPIVVKVPDEAAANIEYVSFASELSDKVSDMRKDALERFAIGADLPRDVVTGTASLNHWGMWQIEESSIKLHVEPLIAVICDALTQQYLWPALRASGVEDPTGYLIWYNASELSHRPNKSAEAQTLWDKGVLSTEALLRENGFSPEDLPEGTEHMRWIAERVVLANPQLLGALRPYLEGGAPGVGAETVSALEPGTGQDQTDERTAPGIQPDNLTLPAAVASATLSGNWWIAAIEQVVLRALELAGKRYMKKLPRPQRRSDPDVNKVHPWDIHTLIDERPTGETVDRLMYRALDTAQVNFGDDPCVLSTLDAYCRDLLINGKPHRREYLAKRLANAGCIPQLQDH